MLRSFAMAVIAVLLLLPFLPGSEATFCRYRTDDGAIAVASEGYVTVDSGPWGSFRTAYFARVWMEENGVPGLQRSGTTCSDGTVVPADSMRAEAPVPDPRVVTV